MQGLLIERLCAKIMVKAFAILHLPELKYELLAFKSWVTKIQNWRTEY